MKNPKVSVKVDTNEFIWDKNEGLFTFDGAPALLFWDSAIELFIKTIEEVSGSDVSITVLEATGFRMGHLVSNYYQDRFDIREVIEQYKDIYRNAGWGNVEIIYFSLEEKKVIIRLKNSWEHRIFKMIDRKQSVVLLPSHWAGVFSGLFKENMWYETKKSQSIGQDYDEIEITVSSTTPSSNIHKLAREKEQQLICELENKVEERTKQLTSLVKDLSSPVIPVLDGILIIPLIGRFTEERYEELIEKALHEFSRRQASHLLIDLTGMNQFDEFTIYGLERLISSIGLLGGECTLVGVSPSLSIQITKSEINLNNLISFSTLQQGVQYALEQSGFEIVKKKKRNTL
ncbi:STAS domain-containing protein [Priestia megaterium]|uniref:STAS domain-containing protein n=1 Tax=Priestia megaterium TaxID=1404 RepID=UPI001F3354BB|nr:STAS domain-containing protein [Priestia megaterium]MCF8890338.1 STAS domain-containing protein [Priestia megaterium]